MTLFELIKKHGVNKGEDVMWRSVDLLSHILEDHLSGEEYHSVKKKIYYEMVGGHFDKEFADAQIAKFYYVDSDGTKHFAPYWAESDVRTLYSGVKGDIGDYNFYDFEVALNMIKSDYCPLLKRWFPDEDKDDHLKRLVSLTVNWLNDTDNPYGTEKVWGYFNK